MIAARHKMTSPAAHGNALATGGRFVGTRLIG
jgi:hypothetical protein